MKEKNAPSLKNPEILFLSFFGVGLAPKAPGTFGTLACLPLYYLLGKFNAPFFLFIPFLTILTIISCYIAEIVQKKYNIHDPGWIVIDEVIGMGVTWLFLQEQSILHYVIIFALFRFFDIVKFWPASYFDKKVEHGMGTILDDVISGIFAGGLYLIGLRAFQNFF